MIEFLATFHLLLSFLELLLCFNIFSFEPALISNNFSVLKDLEIYGTKPFFQVVSLLRV